MKLHGDNRHFLVSLIGIICLFYSGQTAVGENNTDDPFELYHQALIQYNTNQPEIAIVNFRKFLLHIDKSEHIADQANANLHMADIKRSRQELDSAAYFLNKSNALLQQINNPDDVLWSDYFHKQGALLLSQGNHDSAIHAFNRSIKVRKQVSGETDTNLVMTYNNLGITSYYLGLYDQAMNYYQKAVDIIELGEISENRHVGLSYMNKGILFATLGDYIQARLSLINAQNVFEKIYDPEDINLGRFFLNFGRLLQLSGQIDQAVEYYDKAENILQKVIGRDNIYLGSIYLNKSSIYYSLADYERALSYNTRALVIFEENLTPGHTNILAAYLSLGYYYEKKEDYPRAIEYYKKSINEERITPSNIATYRNMANLYSLIGEDEKADSLFNKAIYQSINIFGADHIETALSYATYAKLLTRDQRFTDSDKLLQKAKKIYFEKLGKNDRDYSNTIFRIGSNYFDQGNLLKALNAFQESIISLATDFNDDNPLRNPQPGQLVPDQYLLNPLYLKAKTLHEIHKKENNQNYLELSLETYELSSALINKIRSSYLSNESKLMLTGITYDILIGALDCSLDLYNATNDKYYLEKAFEFTEKGKASVLLSSLNDIEARQLARVPESIQKFERDLTLSLDSYNQLIHEEKLLNEPDQNKINLWQSITFNLSQRYDSLINAIYQQFPEYYDLRFDLSIVTLPELKQYLKQDEALVEYTLSEHELYIFVVTPDSSNAFKFDLPEGFKSNLEKLREHLTGGNIASYSMTDYNDFLRSSHEVYNILLSPIEEVITGRNLIIIPDNQLGYLPFEVLLTNDEHPEVLDFKQLPYLIKNNPVSYAYSATLLQKKLRNDQQTNGKIFAVAPSYDPLNTLAQSSSSRQNNLLPIPWAIDEVNSLIRSFRGNALTASKATETKFKENAHEYEVLHMAMHTLIDNENPMFSKLVFTQSQDTIEDGYLNTYELFNLELNASLAVLSACQTGDGRLQRGEGIMSMARGFFYAGVPSIIMTLWEVDDHSSSELIVLFYKYLKTGVDKNIALQDAKLDYLNTANRLKAHPHYWAGFVNIGNTEPVLLKSSLPSWFLTIPPLLLIGLAVYLWSRKRRNKK